VISIKISSTSDLDAIILFVCASTISVGFSQLPDGHTTVIFETAGPEVTFL